MPPSSPNAGASPGTPIPATTGTTARATAGTPAIECLDLVIRYGTTTAVDGLSFSVHPGEVVALLGPNGAGKTSTLETIEGYRSPTAGHVKVCGLDPQRAHSTVVAHLGVMLQRGGIYPMLDANRALRLFASYYKDPEDPSALLDRLNLTAVARTPWRHLSGGEQARLSLALALVGRPDVLLLDEPTAGVDPEGRQVIRSVIDELRDRTAAILITTHALGEVEQQADRIVIIRGGRTVASGTVAELSHSQGGPNRGTGTTKPAERIAFTSRPELDVTDLAKAVGTPVSEDAPGRYSFTTGDAATTTAKLATWLAHQRATLTELHTGRTLEEIYLDAVSDASTESESEA